MENEMRKHIDTFKNFRLNESKSDVINFEGQQYGIKSVGKNIVYNGWVYKT